jgi:hypothetical protein
MEKDSPGDRPVGPDAPLAYIGTMKFLTIYRLPNGKVPRSGRGSRLMCQPCRDSKRGWPVNPDKYEDVVNYSVILSLKVLVVIGARAAERNVLRLLGDQKERGSIVKERNESARIARLWAMCVTTMVLTLCNLMPLQKARFREVRRRRQIRFLRLLRRLCRIG